MRIDKTGAAGTRGVNTLNVAGDTVLPDKATFVHAVYATLANGYNGQPLASEYSDYGYGGELVEGARALDTGDQYALALTAWYTLHDTTWPTHLLAAEGALWASGQLGRIRPAGHPRRGSRANLELLRDSLAADFAADDQASGFGDRSHRTAFQSAVTALCVQDSDGGRLLSATNAGVAHTWNLLDDGREIDLARADVFSWVPTDVTFTTRATVLGDAAVRERYTDLAELFATFD